MDGTCPLIRWMVAVGVTGRPAGLGDSCFFRNFIEDTFFSVGLPLELSNTNYKELKTFQKS